MEKKLAPKHGFTLIELLVSLSIVAILTASVIPSFSSFSKKQSLVQSAQNFANDVSLMQSKAVNGVASNGVDVDWGIRLGPGCNLGVSSYSVGYFNLSAFYETNNVSLSPGIRISCPDGSDAKDIRFYRISGLLGSSSETINVLSTEISDTLTVAIGERGQTNVE